MTALGTVIATVLVAGAIATGGAFGDDGVQRGAGSRTALVIDAAAASDGRVLVDSRLREVDAAVRLPRTTAEATTNVRYFATQDYRLVVAGPRASAAAKAAGVMAIRASGLSEALATASR